MAQFFSKNLNETIASSLGYIDEMIAIQCQNGSWNYNPYMQGMANGMIFLRSVLTGEEPKYMEAPDVWLEDIPYDGPSLGEKKARKMNKYKITLGDSFLGVKYREVEADGYEIDSDGTLHLHVFTDDDVDEEERKAVVTHSYVGWNAIDQIEVINPNALPVTTFEVVYTNQKETIKADGFIVQDLVNGSFTFYRTVDENCGYQETDNVAFRTNVKSITRIDS